MTEGIWIAIIGVFQVILLAFVGKISKDSSITKQEVKNSHSTNMREEMDKRHAESMKAIHHVSGVVARLDQRDIQRGNELTRINDNIDDLSTDLHKHLRWSSWWSRDIENTLNQKNKKGKT